jgi:hypothetical protein
MMTGIVLWFALLAGGIGGTVQTRPETGRLAEPLTIRVSPMISMEPGLVEVMVRIAANPDNRRLSVEVDGGEYYRSSTMQLDGDGEPITRVIAYRSIPSGMYTVTVTLKNRQGRCTTADHQFRVLSRTGDPIEAAPESFEKDVPVSTGNQGGNVCRARAAWGF